MFFRRCSKTLCSYREIATGFVFEVTSVNRRYIVVGLEEKKAFLDETSNRRKRRNKKKKNKEKGKVVFLEYHVVKEVRRAKKERNKS